MVEVREGGKLVGGRVGAKLEGGRWGGRAMLVGLGGDFILGRRCTQH